MPKTTRPSGIDILGDVPGDTHFCLLYESKSDLLEALVPFFRAGLTSNELCIWAVPEWLEPEEARRALAADVPDLSAALERGQISIVRHRERCLPTGELDLQHALESWEHAVAASGSSGFDGLRVAGDVSWRDPGRRPALTDYEERLDRMVEGRRAIAACGYRLQECQPADLLSAIGSHQFALVRQAGRWQVIENTRGRRALQVLRESEERFRLVVSNSPDVMFYQDRDLRYTWIVNPTPPFTEEQVIGRTDHDLFRAEDARRLVELKRQVLGDGTGVRTDVWVSIDGMARCYEASFQPRRDANGEIVGIAAYLRDITARAEAEGTLAWNARVDAALAELSKALLSGSSTEEVASLVLEEAKLLTSSQFGFVGYVDPHTGYMVSPTLTRDIWESCQVPDRTAVFERFVGLWGWVLQNRRPLLTNSPSTDPRSTGVPVGHIPIRRFLSAPALIGDTLVGQVAVANSERDYSDRDLALIERLAALYALAVQRQRAEDSLRASEQRFRALFNNADDAAFLHGIGKDGTPQPFVEVNDVACRRLGRTRDELVGLSPADVDDPAAAADRPAILRELLERGRVRFETAHVSRDGTAMPVEISSTLFTLNHDLMVLSIARDVRDRKLAESERERLTAELQRQAAELDASITSIPDAVVIYSPTGEIVRMNPAAERILAYTPEERDRPIAERLSALGITSPDGRPLPLEDAPPMKALRGDTVQGAVLVLHRPPGRTAWVSAAAAPIRSAAGSLLGAVATLTDISAIHDLQERHDDFVRALSHDLRTPLTVIQGQAELLRRMLNRDDAKALRERGVNAIIDGARAMNTMIQALVESARLQTGELQPRACALDLREFAHNLAARLSTIVASDRIRVAIPEDLPLVFVDPSHLERILTNLYTNALKYSPPTSDVTVAASARDGEVVVTVVDRGRGIPAEERPHLFTRYFRGGAERDGLEGLGLGLFTAKGLVEANGGRIWVESEVGVGSSFSFALPTASRAQGAQS